MKQEVGGVGGRGELLLALIQWLGRIYKTFQRVKKEEGEAQDRPQTRGSAPP